MSARPTNSEALADSLRETPPVLDDLTRARIEKRVFSASSVPRAPRRSRAPFVALGGGIALAAAAALAVVWWPEAEAPVVAHIDLHDVGAAGLRASLEEGSTVRTRATEEADIQVADTRLRVGGGSRVRIATLSRERLGIDLLEGSVRVAYHPRERGRERMTVETPSARVEVVGTVFRVEVRERGTDVSVSEGTVRVVPLDGSDVRLLHAGDRTHVAREARAAVGAPLAGEVEDPPELAPADPGGADPIGADPSGPEGDPSDSQGSPSEIASGSVGQGVDAQEGDVDPAARLALAKRLIDGGRVSAGARILRELTRAGVPTPVRTEAWSTTGDLDRVAGRLDAAARAYEQAAQVGRGTANGHNAIYTLARLHAQRGDVAAERASYERYLREAPSGALAEQARRALARLGAPSEQGDP